MDRIPPNNTEAERAVIGAGLLNSDAILHNLPSDVFYRTSHQLIYDAIKKINLASHPVDIVTVSNELERTGDLDKVGGRTYIATLTSEVPSIGSAEHYGSIIKTLSVKRKILHAASRVQNECYSPISEPHELVSLFDNEVVDDLGDVEPVPLKTALLESLTEMQDIFEGRKEAGVPTGFVDLDKYLMLSPGELTYLAGRPGMGKSALAAQIAFNIAKKGDNVIYFSLEMRRKKLADRYLSGESQVDGRKISKAQLVDTDYTKVTAAAGRIKDTQVHIVDTPAMTVQDIYATSLKFQKKHGLKVIFVDHIGKIRCHGMGTTERAATVSDGLLTIAKRLNIPVVVLSQLNREVEKSSPPIPSLGNLKDSSALEEDGDQVAFVYRQDYYVEQGLIDPNDKKSGYDPQMDGVCMVIVGKSRGGACGTAWLDFKPKFTKFYDRDRWSS